MFKDPEIRPVDYMLQRENLVFPNYQRPYKWGDKNVSALLYDITGIEMIKSFI